MGFLTESGPIMGVAETAIQQDRNAGQSAKPKRIRKQPPRDPLLIVEVLAERIFQFNVREKDAPRLDCDSLIDELKRALRK